MAELVDALDSGSSIRKDVGVRVPLSAPLKQLYAVGLKGGCPSRIRTCDQVINSHLLYR